MRATVNNDKVGCFRNAHEFVRGFSCICLERLILVARSLELEATVAVSLVGVLLTVLSKYSISTIKYFIEQLYARRLRTLWENSFDIGKDG